MSLSKATKASLINEIEECDYEFDKFTSVLIIIILCVWIVSARRPDKLKLILHLSNFNIYCYLYIAEIIIYPDSIVTQSQDTNVYLTFHSNFCNPYLTISNKDITLISKDYRYIIPSAIAIPNILKHTVRTILNTENSANLMVGTGNCFHIIPIKTLTNDMIPPVTEKIFKEGYNIDT